MSQQRNPPPPSHRPATFKPEAFKLVPAPKYTVGQILLDGVKDLLVMAAWVVVVVGGWVLW